MAALQPGRSSHGSPRRNVSAYQFAATSNYPQIHLGWGEGEGKGRQKGKGDREGFPYPEGSSVQSPGCLPVVFMSHH